RLTFCAVACSWAAAGPAAVRPVEFEMDPHFLRPPHCMRTIGDAHGDIAVSPSGEIYVSVQAGARPGIHVYSARGRYLRKVPQAPYAFHGFVIASAADGTPNIFGASLEGQQIVQLTLQGRVVQIISAASIPDQYKTQQDGKFSVAVTDVAVAPN